MGQNNTAPAPAAPAAPAAKTPACRICCACPTERRYRDECVLLKGTDECETEINNFYKCLLKEGFPQEEVDTLRKNTKRM
ncbi:cytochrome c oxidase assembly protein subunit 17 [Strigomonas culicis]|uniref:Cytochrome c oxidase assembly protein subunit 17 n=1 Tax=Strigomonas culicis TaxID=28005 RepID=S9TCM6_9TRYP|nr:cytochrome c oxidase assembly protein subunit 17 [Strigomonas culicis]|eukprot:EPY15782.1 cytochrome c oxidase assembly protein subunit 17 [Strigomonas culicis]